MNASFIEVTATRAACRAMDVHLDCTFPDCCCKKLPTGITAALAAADAARAKHKRENCQHPNKNGSGTIGSDGSSRYDWYCTDCGASGHLETPARAALTRPRSPDEPKA